MFTRAPALMVVVVLGVLAVGCGGTDQETRSTTSTTAAATAEPFNEADVGFLQGMIPHHEDAVEMAELVEGRTDRPQLNDLAEAVIATQQPEIEQMELLLERAGAPRDGGGHDMSEMDEQSELPPLEDLEGVQFDLAFIDHMTVHHQGAIETANEVIDDGENPEVRALAEEIIAAQQAEIDRMSRWSQDWAPDGN